MSPPATTDPAASTPRRRRLLNGCGVALACLAAALTGCADEPDPSAGTSLRPTDADAQRSAPAAAPLSFNRDVRPILADKCFNCHGPDRAARAADLRLDQPDDGDGYVGALSVLKPGDPDLSLLVARITTDDERRVMPPPESHLTLTDAERATLTRWVAQGAEYERHWAFVPPAHDVPTPDVRDEAWPRDDLDRYVLARLDAEGLTPAPEASPERWLRRVTFDLTGLPPTPDDLDAFTAALADASDDAQRDNAYAQVVDRLLASPHFGERLAVPWLDLARYADTYGYTVDGYRAAWPWRDWLINALNNNLPYDDFITWQLAGDLLPDATDEQRLATAFNRLHRMNAEGGAIAEEWRNEYVADRLHTFGTAFLGLTLECARCHDHRYDPVSQPEYYELFAFFNSIDESGTAEYHRPDIAPPPTMLLPTDAQRARLAELQQAVTEAEAALAQTIADREPDFQAWLNALDTNPAQPILPELIGDYPLDAIGEGNTLANRVPDGAPGHAAQFESITMPTVEPGRAADTNGAANHAIRLDGDNLLHVPGTDDLDRWTPFTVALWFKVDALDDGPPRVIAHRTSGTDVGPYGHDLVLDRGTLMARAYRHWPGNAIAVQTGDAIIPGEWTHVVWRYDGASSAAGLSLFINGQPTPLTVVRDGTLRKVIGGGHPYGPGGHQLVVGQRFRGRGLSGSVIDHLHLARRDLSDLEAQHLHDGAALTDALDARNADALRGYFFSALDAPTRDAQAALTAARTAYIQHENAIPEISIMQEMPEPRPAHVLNRGLYDAPRTDDNRVHRDTPEDVFPFDAPGNEDAPRDRLGLARWLIHPDHPLTARVAVNRLWIICFGRGIVGTPDNLGLQGSSPTHPDLLDHLARRFINSGWDTKALLRAIVLSATYRQDSATTDNQWRDDPDNALLARGPSRRLDAEMIRDAALAASGLLVPTVGGASVHPYQPAGVWEEVSGGRYPQGSGAALYRRSMYTYWKRAAPMPSMMVFDTPTREACTAERQSTNTPLQALVLLNDVQYIEAARVLAEQLLTDGEAVIADEIADGFRRVTGRAPTHTERDRLAALHAEQHSYFAATPDDAAALLTLGDAPRDESLDPADHAALTVTMHAVLNLDAAVWLR